MRAIDLLAIGARAAAGFAQLGLIYVIALDMTPEGARLSISGIALANVVAVLARLGAEHEYIGMSGHAAISAVQAAAETTRGVVKRGLLLTLTAAALALVTFRLGRFDIAHAVLWIAALLLPVSLSGHYQVILASLGRATVAPILSVALPTLVAIIAMRTGAASSAVELMIWYVTAIMVGVASAFVWADRLLGRSLGPAIISSHAQPLMGRSSTNNVLAVVQNMMVWGPTALAGMTLAPSSVAAVAVAFRFGGAITLGSNALTAASLQRLVRHTRENRPSDVVRCLGEIRRASAVIASAGCLLFLVLVTWNREAAHAQTNEDVWASILIVGAYGVVASFGPLTPVLILAGRSEHALRAVLRGFVPYVLTVALMLLLGLWSALALGVVTLAYSLMVNLQNARSVAVWQSREVLR